MVRIGRREITVPLSLWTALPLAAVLYDLWDAVFGSLSIYRYAFRDADRYFLSLMTQLGAAALAAFLMVDIVRRARTPWYAIPLVYLIGTAAATFVVNEIISGPFTNVMQFVVGAAIMIASSVRGPGSGGLVLGAIIIVCAFLLAIGASLFVTLASRLVSGLPIRVRETWREFWANLFGATLWIVIAVGGYAIIRSAFALSTGVSAEVVPKWLPYACACAGALVATALHLVLVRRSRRDTDAPAEGHVRVWLLALLCIAVFVYQPYRFGTLAGTAYYDYVRPALRAVHVIPTPPLTVAKYDIDVPFHDRKVVRGMPQPDGSLTYIEAILPESYGLSNGREPRVNIALRSAMPNHVSPFWEPRRKELDAAQAAQPGGDVVVRPSSPPNALAMRLAEYPELDFQVAFFDPALRSETAEAVLRQFVKERVRPRN